MSASRTAVALFAATLLSMPVAVTAQEQQPVQIFEYAVSHPVDDAQLSLVPSIGASVPPAVTVATAEGTADSIYGYFYYQGRPVIVDMTTRSIVRIGN